ncbi:MAG TPA: D-2-hydroxyacid dehydrogenase family protein [Bryobacteraceae bacterium]|nr:D-2-hydroxyacid dehydrogenase family protein [Bryobacteraceae bacterium]
MDKTQIAVLDDYQGVALQMADWSPLASRAEVIVYRDHLSDFGGLAERLAPFDVVCVMRERTPITRALLQLLPNLKLIVSTGKRNASIDLQAAAEQGVLVCHTGYLGHGAAELTWTLILAALKNLAAETTSVRRGNWQTTVGRDLKSSTIGIVGLGNLGSIIARYARTFEMNVIAWSTNLTREKAEAEGAHLVSKEQLFREADVVTVHLVSSDRNRAIIGAPELNQMKSSAWLVNTSRGPLVDESALVEVLTARKIGGAALDVFNEEPLPPQHPFRYLDNVLATPHIGFVTESTYQVFFRDTVENIAAWLDGHPIRKMN